MSNITTLADFVRPVGKKIVLVGGCFDLVHPGHVRFLAEAKKRGEVLVVALESDTAISNRKSRLALFSQPERAELLLGLATVDSVILLPDHMTDKMYEDLVATVQPTVIAVTKGDPYVRQKQAHADKVGGKVVAVAPLYSKYSTTKLLAKMGTLEKLQTGD